MVRKADTRALTLLAAVPAVLFAGILLSGRTLFWGDLTYIHHPWRALAAEQLQRGALPHWNPYAYGGMPLAAELQCAAWYPGTLPFHLFPFARALALFHTLHYALAGAFAFLWLRKEGFSRPAALGGAFVFMGCGPMASRAPFLNHLSCLALLPAFLLLRRQPWLLGLALLLCLLGGYPTILAGGALVALVLPTLLGKDGRASSRGLAAWAAAGLLAAAIGACLLLPAARLAADTHRGAGLGIEDTLRFALEPADLVNLLSPLVASSGSPAVNWWKTCYLGLAAWLAMALAWSGLKPRALAALWACAGAVLLLELGGSTPFSLWLWSWLPPLRFVRYPGNLAFLSILAFVLLAAAGLHGWRRAGWLAAVAALELCCYALGSQPVVGSGYFTDPGPLARALQSSLQGDRYLLSPMSLHWHRGAGPSGGAAALNLKHRLYGLTNIPYHLRAVGSFGEPLVPRASYDFMDFLFSRPGLDAAAPWLPWAGARVALTRDRIPARRLEYRGETLWHEYSVPPGRFRGRAFWLAPEDGAALPAGIPADGRPPDIRRARPLKFEMSREDRWRVRGEAGPGWIYVAEPRTAGWRLWLHGRPIESTPALGVFQKARAPGGGLDLRALYTPPGWAAGLLVTLLALLGSSAYWYRRLWYNQLPRE